MNSDRLLVESGLNWESARENASWGVDIMRTIIKTVKQIVCAASFVLLCASAATAALPKDCKNVPTDKGLVSGKLALKGTVCDYRGIPYAAPPIGELRFAQTRDREPWTGTLEAVKWGGKCPQNYKPIVSSSEPSDESCLYLNIWHPVAGDKPKPVMIFIHGGGFLYGSGSELFSSEHLAARGDVVAVTINYRLGALGFLSHPALRDEDGHSGNYGLYDQLAAIKWVKKNIANFGGDPNNITIFGESAGGMSVGLQLASPLARGLFKQAIIESGPTLIVNMPLDAAEQIGVKAAAKLGCDNIKTAADCLRRIPAERFVKELKMDIFFFAVPGEENFYTGPIVDGGFIPDNPYRIFKYGNFDSSVKVILGSNKDEASILATSKKIESNEQFDATIKSDTEMLREAFGLEPFAGGLLDLYPTASYQNPKAAYNDMLCDLAFTCTTRVLAGLISKWQPDTYLYYFSKAPTSQPPFDKAGAFHGSELVFVFRKFALMGMRFDSKENLAVSDSMISLWSSFARSGVPTAAGVPAWPKYDTATEPHLRIDVSLAVEFKFKSDSCSVLEKNIRTAFDK
ncbi:MAG: carboxylesterase/lipase family protein [bacterium]